jgi:hypothetical protein
MSQHREPSERSLVFTGAELFDDPFGTVKTDAIIAQRYSRPTACGERHIPPRHTPLRRSLRESGAATASDERRSRPRLAIERGPSREQRAAHGTLFIVTAIGTGVEGNRNPSWTSITCFRALFSVSPATPLNLALERHEIVKRSPCPMLVGTGVEYRQLAGLTVSGGRRFP